MAESKKKPSRAQGTLEATVKNLKIAVALSDMNGSEICTKAGLSRNVLGKFLRGETSISYNNLLSVCEVLDIPIEVLASDTPVTKARIRLFRILAQLSENQIAAALETVKRKSVQSLTDL